MRHLIVLIIAVFFWILALLLKKHKEIITISGIVALAIINGVYCYTHTDSILSKRYPVNQTFFDPVYCEKGEFPDAFLRLFLKGKKIYVKNDRYILPELEERGDCWLSAYYHVENMENYIDSVYAEFEEDESMNSIVLNDEQARTFEQLGYLNDLLRNTVMYTKVDWELGNFDYFLWYYTNFAKTGYIYGNIESLNEDELVLIWQPKGDDTPIEAATEDMYLMGKNYFEENIRK